MAGYDVGVLPGEDALVMGDTDAIPGRIFFCARAAALVLSDRLQLDERILSFQKRV